MDKFRCKAIRQRTNENVSLSDGAVMELVLNACAIGQSENTLHTAVLILY